MLFILKHFDTSLLTLSAHPQNSDPEYHIARQFQENAHLLSLRMEAVVKQPRYRAMLRKFLGFRFDRRATRYNLLPQRLKILEKEVRHRAKVSLSEYQSK